MLGHPACGERVSERGDLHLYRVPKTVEIRQRDGGTRPADAIARRRRILHCAQQRARRLDQASGAGQIDRAHIGQWRLAACKPLGRREGRGGGVAGTPERGGGAEAGLRGGVEPT